MTVWWYVVVAVRLLCSCQEQKFLLHPESNCCSSKRFEGICKFWRSVCKTIVEFEEASSLVWDVELTLVVYFEMLCLWCSCGRTSSLRRNPELFKDLAVGFYVSTMKSLVLSRHSDTVPFKAEIGDQGMKVGDDAKRLFFGWSFLRLVETYYIIKSKDKSKETYCIIVLTIRTGGNLMKFAHKCSPFRAASNH